MKRIILIVLSICLLTSCSKTQEVIDNDNDEVIEYHNNYDNLTPTTVIEYNEEVEPNNSWILSGKGTYTEDFTSKTIRGIYGGEGNYEDSVLESPLFALNNVSYNVSFNINSNIDKTVNLRIGSDSRTYLDTYFEVQSSDNNYSFDFNGALDYGVKVYFYLGNKSNESHTITIKDFCLRTSNGIIGTRINQLGYLTNAEKQVVFNYTPGDYFYVINADTNDIVYTGDISSTIEETDTNEYLYKAYFGDVNKEGSYYIQSELGISSKVFEVNNDLYDDLSEDVLYFIYLQRCGVDIVDNKYGLSHAACHTSESKVWTTLEDIYIDTTGGWHDAGDYGKYLYDINQVIADLEFAYLYSNNKKEELLSEIRYGLEFLLKLQTDSYSTYNKIVSKEFSQVVSPEYDNQETYALARWTLTTCSTAGVMGLAYEIFNDNDKEFSNKCLDSFNGAIEYVYNNQLANNEINPDGFNVGTYYVGDEYDERLFAYSVAYKLTKDEKYLELVNGALSNEFDGYNYKAYSFVTLLDSLDMGTDYYNKIKDKFSSYCDSLADGIKNNSYAYPYISYSGGSNEHVSEAVSALLLGARYLKDERYLKRGQEAICYLLGMNGLNLCFVYGYGDNHPHSMHNRLAMSHGLKYIKGALSSGSNEVLEGVMKDYFNEDTPKALRFLDNEYSYGNVEPCVNYNSALVLSLSLLDYANNNKLQ